jgi:hypothetical protein
MAITALYENSASISTTEYSLTNNSTSIAAKTDDGVFQCFLDLNALASGDEYELRIYEKVQSAGTQRIVYRSYFVGAQSEPHFVTPSLVLMHGWDITLDKLAGTDRTIGWSIRQVA